METTSWRTLLIASCITSLTAQAETLTDLSLGTATSALDIRNEFIVLTKEIKELDEVDTVKIIDDYIIVEASQSAKYANQQSSSKGSASRLVVSENGTNTLGLTEGEVILEYRRRDDVESITSDYEVSLVGELHGLNRVVVQVSDLGSLSEILASLKSDFRVASVELVIDYGKPVEQ
jgi:hypothetical protein